MESGLMDADMPLEEVWADLKEVLRDRLPEPIFPEDQGWFSMAQYRKRYKQGEKSVRRDLARWVDDGTLEVQIQRRHGYNVKCYRAVKDRPA